MNRRLALVLALGSTLLLSSLVAGCVVVPRHRVGLRVAVPVPSVAVSYQPLYFQGNAVFYTGAGVPFYYSGGARIYLPGPARPRYVRHYRAHRQAYHSWEKHNRSSHERRGGHKGKAEHKPVLRPRS